MSLLLYDRLDFFSFYLNWLFEMEKTRFYFFFLYFVYFQDAATILEEERNGIFRVLDIGTFFTFSETAPFV